MSTVEIKSEVREAKSILDEIFKGHNAFILYFRQGNRPPMSKVFMNKGNLHNAIERAKQHCAVMDYKFCGVYSFIVDLDEQEKIRENELGVHI